MAAWTERAELLFKKEGLEKLKNANVLIVGVGGVGSFAAEFIARAGVGKITIVDGDVVDITNINRQLPALHLSLLVSSLRYTIPITKWPRERLHPHGMKSMSGL